ncbi:MAG: FHA domain-containing protein [Deltaproteobacteria bacterium]|nr:FHA domain-containing protein [Deltaproteobacteria bacterium]
MSSSNRSPKTVAIADHLWEALEVMSCEMGVDRDMLLSQAVFTLARLNGYLVPGRIGAEADAPRPAVAQAVCEIDAGLLPAAAQVPLEEPPRREAALEPAPAEPPSAEPEYDLTPAPAPLPELRGERATDELMAPLDLPAPEFALSEPPKAAPDVELTPVAVSLPELRSIRSSPQDEAVLEPTPAEPPNAEAEIELPPAPAPLLEARGKRSFPKTDLTAEPVAEPAPDVPKHDLTPAPVPLPEVRGKRPSQRIERVPSLEAEPAAKTVESKAKPELAKPKPPVDPDEMPARQRAAERIRAVNAEVERQVRVPARPAPVPEPEELPESEPEPEAMSESGFEAMHDSEPEEESEERPEPEVLTTTRSSPELPVLVDEVDEELSPDHKTQAGSVSPMEMGEPEPVEVFLHVEGAEPVLVSNERFIMGRGKHCDLVLLSNRVSREHAVIIRQGEKIVLEDLNSSNGTWMDQKRITKRVLSDGDVFTLGNVRVRCDVGPQE